MSRLTPSIVIVLSIVALSVTAGSIEPEWKSLDRDQLETAYVKKLEEVAQLRRELAIAKKTIAELTPKPAAESTDAQVQTERSKPAKVHRSAKALIQSVPKESRPTSSPLNRAAIELMNQELAKRVGDELTARMELLTADKIAHGRISSRIDGVSFYVYIDHDGYELAELAKLKVGTVIPVTGIITEAKARQAGGVVQVRIKLSTQ